MVDVFLLNLVSFIGDCTLTYLYLLLIKRLCLMLVSIIEDEVTLK